jgi:hypothetical protein
MSVFILSCPSYNVYMYQNITWNPINMYNFMCQFKNKERSSQDSAVSNVQLLCYKTGNRNPKSYLSLIPIPQIKQKFPLCFEAQALVTNTVLSVCQIGNAS